MRLLLIESYSYDEREWRSLGLADNIEDSQQLAMEYFGKEAIVSNYPDPKSKRDCVWCNIIEWKYPEDRRPNKDSVSARWVEVNTLFD